MTNRLERLTALQAALDAAIQNNDVSPSAEYLRSEIANLLQRREPTLNERLRAAYPVITTIARCTPRTDPRLFGGVTQAQRAIEKHLGMPSEPNKAERRQQRRR